MSEPAYPLSSPDWPRQGSWTYEDYLRLPDDGQRYEVIRGHLYVAPAPSFAHQFAVSKLLRFLDTWVDENNLGVVLAAPFDVRLPARIGDPVQPDIVYIRKAVQPRSGDPNFQGAPDLVVEVASPSTRRLDRTVKLSAYRDAGVSEVWLVDPKARTVQVLVSSAEGEYRDLGLFRSGEEAFSAVLPGLRVNVDRIFPPPDR
jgi:Uma2 family endonuclease